MKDTHTDTETKNTDTQTKNTDTQTKNYSNRRMDRVLSELSNKVPLVKKGFILTGCSPSVSISVSPSSLSLVTPGDYR